MTNSKKTRLSYEESCRELQKLGWLDSRPLPVLPAKRPNYDDEEPLGIRIFRALLSNDALEDMTLPRTFFGRSEIRSVSFRGTDLSESTLCWNDFVSVDFTDCDLSRSDLRASFFKGVKFTGANLSQTDLRRSSFKTCDFSNANLEEAKLTAAQAGRLNLSTAQKNEIDWQVEDGEEPGGG